VAGTVFFKTEIMFKSKQHPLGDIRRQNVKHIGYNIHRLFLIGSINQKGEKSKKLICDPDPFPYRKANLVRK